jgi:hypothetical protein
MEYVLRYALKRRDQSSHDDQIFVILLVAHFSCSHVRRFEKNDFFVILNFVSFRNCKTKRKEADDANLLISHLLIEIDSND